MLECNESNVTQIFYQQLQRVAAEIAQKRPKYINVVFFHKNARLSQLNF